MANGRKGMDNASFNQRQQRAVRWNDNEFVRLELNEAQKAECKAWCSELGELDAIVGQFIDDGYRVSVKYDSYSSAYGSFGQLATDDGKHQNSHLVLTGRGSTPLKAIKQMLYKHVHILEGSWGDEVSARYSDAIDD